MKILALDLSTKTGWSVLETGLKPVYGQFVVSVEDFNVNNHPNNSPKYPYNMIKAAKDMADKVWLLLKEQQPTHIVIENTVKGRNRHTQRILEWIHWSVLEKLNGKPFIYMDPSEWRAILELRLNKEQKKNNQLVSKGKKRGRVTKKHLAVNWANETYKLNLRVKDNDIADSLGLATAAMYKLNKE